MRRPPSTTAQYLPHIYQDYLHVSELVFCSLICHNIWNSFDTGLVVPLVPLLAHRSSISFGTEGGEKVWHFRFTWKFTIRKLGLASGVRNDRDGRAMAQTAAERKGAVTSNRTPIQISPVASSIRRGWSSGGDGTAIKLCCCHFCSMA